MEIQNCIYFFSILFYGLFFQIQGKPTIGIIGGGVSGLGAARRLMESGEYNVVVLEKGSEPVPLQHRVHNNGHTHDMDLIFLPGLSWEGYGVEKRWKTLLDQHQVELLPVSEYGNGKTFTSFDVYEERNRSFEYSHENYEIDLDPEQSYHEIRHFISNYQSFYSNNKYNGIQTCLNENIAYSNETFKEWYQRNNYPNIGYLSSFILALYGNIPVANSPACQVLMLLSNKMPSVIGPYVPLLLKQLASKGIDPLSISQQLPELTHLWTTGLHLNDRDHFMFSFRKGYAHFFQQVVRQANIDYRTNVQVESLKKVKNGIQVTTEHGSTFLFDHVIVATRPEQALSFLPSSHPMTPLYERVREVVEQREIEHGTYAVAILKALPQPNSQLDQLNHPIYVLNNKIMHDSMINDHVSKTNLTIMRIIKQFEDSEYITVVWQCPHHLVDSQQEIGMLKKSLINFGYQDSIQVIKLQHYPNTPTSLTPQDIMDGWYDTAFKAQGKEGIHFVGEIFSGHGVPTTWLYSEDYVSKHFISESNTKKNFVNTQSSLQWVEKLDEMDTSLETIGMEMFSTLLKHPIHAINVGIHPLLVIDWTEEIGVLPYMFVWYLLWIGIMYKLLEYGFSNFTFIPHEKMKNMTIYTMECIISTFLLVVAFSGTWDLLTFQFPQNIMETTNAVIVCIVGMNGLYLSELFYHDQMRKSLKIHHYACIGLLQLMTMLYMEERQMAVLRMGLYNTLFALTEQNVFLIMILHRACPQFLQSYPLIPLISAYFYGLSRWMIAGLCCLAWYEFLHLPLNSMIAWGMSMGYPILLFIQIGMQWKCYQSLEGLAKRYFQTYTAVGDITKFGESKKID